MNLNALPAEVRAGFEDLSGAQRDVLVQAPAEMRGFLEAQMKMQKEQELTQLITGLLKGDHEQAMTVMRNIGG